MIGKNGRFKGADGTVRTRTGARRSQRKKVSSNHAAQKRAGRASASIRCGVVTGQPNQKRNANGENTARLHTIRVHLSWRELEYGIVQGWLDSQAETERAIDQVASERSPEDGVLELAGLRVTMKALGRTVTLDGATYNSNSYAAGLLLAVGLTPPKVPESTPGKDQPVPMKEFR